MVLQTEHGLSPRMRGNQCICQKVDVLYGSIPARAGEPCWYCRPIGLTTVYPRACGGTWHHTEDQVTDYGLSPRVRGNRRQPETHHKVGGSIPARAGEPLSTRPVRRLREVYPRACGGTGWSHRLPPLIEGLSPRVRGNPDNPLNPLDVFRSIPARAGEPRAGDRAATEWKVYPRACGGTRLSKGIT